MMSLFEACIPFVLANEGGILKDPITGEYSNFGVTQKLLVSVNWYPSDPKDLDINSAKNVYYIFFWQKWHLDQITSNNFAAKIFDMMVNMGPRQAALIIQEALGFAPAHIDGILGGFTTQDLNQWSETTMMPKIVEGCEKFYTTIAVGDKAKYLNGWLIRAKRTPNLSTP